MMTEKCFFFPKSMFGHYLCSASCGDIRFCTGVLNLKDILLPFLIYFILTITVRRITVWPVAEVLCCEGREFMEHSLQPTTVCHR